MNRAEQHPHPTLPVGRKPPKGSGGSLPDPSLSQPPTPLLATHPRLIGHSILLNNLLIPQYLCLRFNLRTGIVFLDSLAGIVVAMTPWRESGWASDLT
jgi:hypothetical protein